MSNKTTTTRRIRLDLPMRAQSQASVLLERVLSEGDVEDQQRPILRRTRTEQPQQQRAKEQRLLGANKHSPAALLLRKVLYEDEDQDQEDRTTSWRRRPQLRRSRTSNSATPTPTLQRPQPSAQAANSSHASASSQRASKHFPFLSLPVELRIRIYNSLPRRQRFRRSDRDYVYRGQVFDPTVLRVCSDVYKEALPELYRLATLSLRADYFQNYLRPSYGKDPGPPFWPAVTITGDVAAGGNGPERALDGEGEEGWAEEIGDPRCRASFVGHMFFRCHDISTFPVSWPQSRVDRFVEALRLAPQLQSLTLRTTDNMWLRKGDKHVLYALEVLRQIRNAGPFELKIVVREQGAEDSVFALKECGFCVVWEKGGEEVEVEHEGGEADEGNADAGPEEGEEDEVLTYWGANTRCAALRV